MVLFGGHVVLIFRFNYTVWRQWYYKRCKQKENLVPPSVSNLLASEQDFPHSQWVMLGRLNSRGCLGCALASSACGYGEQAAVSAHVSYLCAVP